MKKRLKQMRKGYLHSTLEEFHEPLDTKSDEKNDPDVEEAASALAEVVDDPVIIEFLKEYVKIDKSLRASLKEYLMNGIQQLRD